MTFPPTDNSYWQTQGYPECGGNGRQSPIDIDTTLTTPMTLVEDDFANFTFSVGYKIVTSGPLINDGGHTRNTFPSPTFKYVEARL